MKNQYKTVLMQINDWDWHLTAEVKFQPGCPGDMGTTQPTRDHWELTGNFYTDKDADVSAAIAEMDRALNGKLIESFNEQVNG
jgi:hypothetical protein